MEIHSWMIKMIKYHLKVAFVIIFHLKKIMSSKQILKMAMSLATIVNSWDSELNSEIVSSMVR